MDASTTALLTNKYIQYYHVLRDEFKHRTGEYPREYRGSSDRNAIESLLINITEKDKNIKEVTVELMSGLISLQALPNLNHRTTIEFVGVYLLANKVYLKDYENNKWEYDRFAEESKHAILNERSIRSQMSNVDGETRKWLYENCLGEHLTLTAEYFDKLVQSGNPVEMPLRRLKEAFSNADRL